MRHVWDSYESIYIIYLPDKFDKDEASFADKTLEHTFSEHNKNLHTRIFQICSKFYTQDPKIQVCESFNLPPSKGRFLSESFTWSLKAWSVELDATVTLSIQTPP